MREREGRMRRCVGAVQERHGAFDAAVHLSVADLRLRQHRHREAVHVLQAGCCRCSSSGGERDGTSTLSQIVLTHHTVKDLGSSPRLGGAEKPLLPPLTGRRAPGAVQEKESALLAEIIAKVNDLFDGELTDDDQLVYVNSVLKGKLLESQELIMQATNNTKAQFANSPTLGNELMDAIIDAFAAHTTMSKQALDSDKVRAGLKDVNSARAWPTLGIFTGDGVGDIGQRLTEAHLTRVEIIQENNQLRSAGRSALPRQFHCRYREDRVSWYANPGCYLSSMERTVGTFPETWIWRRSRAASKDRPPALLKIAALIGVALVPTFDAVGVKGLGRSPRRSGVQRPLVV